MIVGTAGHIDHGKTSLVKALTHVDTNRLKEEKARGISIDLGFAYLPVEAETIGFIDVPGHEKFIHTMLAGASGIDFVLLVVAADDGIMPQSREHLAIIDLLGVEHGVVALTKADLVPEERLVEVETELRNELAATALRAAPILRASTVTGKGIDQLRDHIVEAARQFSSREADGRFRLAVDRSFTLQGTGTVVTGTVLSGRVAVEDHVIVSPSGIAARVRSIHSQNRPSREGKAGDRCALNLAGEAISKSAISRGDMILDQSLHAPTIRIDATLRVLGSEPKPIGHWFPIRLHHASTEVGARVVLLGDAPIAPGTAANVQLVLDQPIAAAAGDRYIIRDTSARRTVGGGRFLDLRAPARKRRTPERRAQIEAHLFSDPAKALEALLETAPYQLDLTAFVRDRALAATKTDELAQALGAILLPAAPDLKAISASRWASFREDLLGRLDLFHADNPDLLGIGVERLRTQLEPRLPIAAFRSALQRLAGAGEIVIDGAWVRRAGHAVTMGPADEHFWRNIEPLLDGAERFRPPRVRDIATALAVPEPEVRRLLKLASRIGKTHEIAHDHFFLRRAVADMVAIIAGLSAEREKGWFTAAEFRDQVENGRKVAIQILDFFDRHSVTVRREDLRRINRDRLDLFGVSAKVTSDKLASGGDASPVGRPDFKSGRGRETVFGGFDSHSLPPTIRRSEPPR
ncbi:selenocysteine-specific elongation factor [Phyllobacterium sp. CL33Tsu]|nr:selenocysteine-specific elongation factor [Phyllobacterium sp. CL33Tsu]